MARDRFRAAWRRSGEAIGIAAWFLLAYPGLAGPQQPANNSRMVHPARRPSPDKALLRLPLAFEPNLGQAGPQVEFLAHGRGYTLLLERDGAELWFDTDRQKASPERPESNSDRRRGSVVRGPSRVAFNIRQRSADILRMSFLGASPDSHAAGLGELPGKSNYFIGNDPRRWQRNVPNFARVKFADVYRGIDLVYYGNPQELEYDFVIKPGADPKDITLKVETGNWKLKNGNTKSKSGEARTSRLHARSQPRLRRAVNGDLVIGVDGSEIRFRRPVLYQEGLAGASGSAARELKTRAMPGLRTLVDGRWLLESNNEATFQVGDYDHSKPLIIDPSLSYATYLGGSGFDYAYGVAVDSSGNAYVVGQTDSPNFPVQGAVQSAGGACPAGNYDTYCFDVFVSKVNASGTGLVYSTYLGGSGDDHGTSIAVDSGGNTYITGYTDSTDFPTVNPIEGTYRGGNCGESSSFVNCHEAFVTKLNAAGSALVYSTYLGGSADNFGFGVAVDATGRAYVAGFTSSTDFPITPDSFQPLYGGGDFDGFVTELSATGSSAIYSTYLGGAGDDRASAIAVDASGDAYVTGSTNSTDFPLEAPFQGANGGGVSDAFVSKLNAGGATLAYSTYLGGAGGDDGYGIAVDSSGSAYVAGLTTSTNFPVTPGAFQVTGGGTSYAAFVTKLSPAGSALAYSTYLGGLGSQSANAIAVDLSGKAYVTGYNDGGDFPVSSPIQASNAGFYDATVSLLNAAGSALIFSTYLGGTGDEAGQGIAVDSSGNAYVVGGTFSTDLPATPGAFQTSYGGGAYDGFLAKYSNLVLPVIALSPPRLLFPSQAVGTTSAPQSVVLANNGDAALLISSIAPGGDVEETNDCPLSLAPGTACTISVTSSPRVFGPLTGSVTITDNAWGSPHVISVAGSGNSSPAVVFSPSSLVFGPQVVGITSSPSSVTMANSGDEPLNLSSIAAGSPFAVTNNCPAALAPKLSCTIWTTFVAASTGAVTGAITMIDDAPGSPHTVAISGSGLANFALTASNSSATILRGTDKAAFALSATTSYGFTGAVSLSCALASGAQCVFNPPELTSGHWSELVVSGLAAAPNPVSLIVNGASGSQSVSLSLTILISDFAITASPSASTITAGQSASSTITLTPLQGFSQPVSLACAGAPPMSTCALASTAVTLNGASASQVTLTIATMARGGLAPNPRGNPFLPRLGPGPDLGSTVGWWAAALLMMLGVAPGRMRGRSRASVAIVCFLVLSAWACGGGSSGSAPPPASTGTTPGTYTLTVTGSSGSLVHSATVTLLVN